ncbi:MAG: hypothetical protein CMD27_00335 [Flavobacteriales bacterium]|nr:hypothetical protein [Flavobacteriales bacterium]
MRNLLILIIIPIIIYSQNYNGPESIEYNSNNGSYYISNSNNGQILELNNDNDLSVFTSNINTGGPHGLELVGQTLFVCSGSNLLGYNWFGNQILNYDMDGVFLNGITQRWEGDENDIIDLFITDFSGKKLYHYSIAENTHYEVCSFDKNPNGVYYDYINSRLLVVFWGWNAPVYEVNIESGTYNTIINTGLSNLDGITMDQCGNFYISAWSSNAIHKYNSDFTETEIIIEGMSNPADICFNESDNIIGIPNSGNNTVEFINYSCDNTNTTEHIRKNEIIFSTNLLGQSDNQSKFQFNIYNDGTIDKIYILK